MLFLLETPQLLPQKNSDNIVAVEVQDEYRVRLREIWCKKYMIAWVCREKV
jgi:hypothetical protein